MTACFLAVLPPNIKLQFQTCIKVYHSVLSVLLSTISLNYKSYASKCKSVRSKVVFDGTDSIARICQQMIVIASEINPIFNSLFREIQKTTWWLAGTLKKASKLKPLPLKNWQLMAIHQLEQL